MTYKLFLDDWRMPKSTYPEYKDDPDFLKDLKIARSYKEAVALVTQLGAPYMLLLDYDLGENEFDTGLTFVNWFIEYIHTAGTVLPPDFSYECHTNSKTGEKLMRDALQKL